MDTTIAKQQIAEDIKNNKVLLYMKGNKMAPQCGFSAQVVQVLLQLEVDFETRDILKDEELRQAIKDTQIGLHYLSCMLIKSL